MRFELASLAILSALTSPVASTFPTTSLSPTELFSLGSNCSKNGALSCHNSSAVNTCCVESPGGLLLQTQFWDTNPATGPSDSWTIHGLWPDNCDGTFDANCDHSRRYTNIAKLLSDQGASDTLEYMQEFWVNINGNDEELWEHEWAKHGTCLSTLRRTCLPKDSAKGAEAVAFYRTVVKLFKTLPTYTWLEQAGITPDETQTYALDDLISVLQTASGFVPALGCRGRVLDEIHWYFNLKGSVIDGSFVPIDSPKESSCPSSGIKYPPKPGASRIAGSIATHAQETLNSA